MTATARSAETASHSDAAPPTPDAAPASDTNSLSGGDGADEADGAGSDDEADPDSDDEEPALRYRRLGGSLDSLLSRDSASALVATQRFLVVGTHWGNVVVLDYLGTEVQRWRAHSAAVSSLSVDLAGEHVASSGDDGRVVVRCVALDSSGGGSAQDNSSSSSSSDTVIVQYSRAVRCVALDPLFARGSRRFMCGATDGHVVLHDARQARRWFGGGSAEGTDTIVFSSAGPVQALAWAGDLAAWAADEGVQVYDVARSQRVALVGRPPAAGAAAAAVQADMFACRLQWTDARTLAVAWGDSVQVVHVRGGRDGAVHAEIAVALRTDFVACGVAPLDDSLLLLAYGDALTAGGRADVRRGEAPPVELRVVSRAQMEEVSSDVLALAAHELLQPNDYALAPCADGWLVASPKQLVLVSPRGLLDHVQWLAARARWADALEDIDGARAGGSRWAASAAEVSDALRRDVGEHLARELLDSGDAPAAAAVCARVLPREATAQARDAWETWVFAFAEARALDALAGVLPVGAPQLSAAAYEMALAHVLSRDTCMLRRLVAAWPAHLYGAQSVALALEDRLKDPLVAEDDVVRLKRTAAELYDRVNQPAKALRFLLEVFAPDLVPRIRREHLLDAVRDKAELLLRYDDHMLLADSDDDEGGSGGGGGVPLALRAGQPAAVLLADSADAIPPRAVVRQLVPFPQHLHVYLHALRTHDAPSAAPFADLQVELYAEYDAPLLLPFLRATTAYSLDRALAVCEERLLVPAMVHILGRMGDGHRALMLIIERLHDVALAIDFAREQADPALWRDLVMYARDKPEFVVGLLEHAGGLGGVSPVQVVRAVPRDLHVPGIRRAVVRVLADHRMLVELGADARRIVLADCDMLADQVRRLRHQGVPVRAAAATAAAAEDTVDAGALLPGDKLCLVCQRPLGGAPDTAALGFWCGHVFHDSCVLLPEVWRKSQMPGARGRGQGGATGWVQRKLDRALVISRFACVCPVCEPPEGAGEDGGRVREGWAPAERTDVGRAPVRQMDVPPIQQLLI
ncbi:Vacuolar protein sorting-associated protein 41 [Coemansia erecta]|uniref:Vacuolar protein sorting-associated protein 41 n=1 Tax=Coemansia erecta TaxID=147472 RepID=A0A9W7XVR5_9FUNG|nr:Vacuolar protein sorting-associated protein 41 [Coemansia erecta]